MEYDDATAFLFGLQRYGTQPGIESVAGLLAELGDPHETVPAVQIAGSNGKGSTARMTERILREAGYSVGLYTSPHLEDYRERIRVDGQYIPEAAVVAFAELVEPAVMERAVDGDPPTFFEATTALALWYFDQADVDVAVLEVGIGGRRDATSVVDPIASAVTSVTLEHADLLGDTIEAIACDKAHVAPTDRPVVTAASDAAVAAIADVAAAVRTVGPASDRDIQTVYHGKQNRAEAAVELTAEDWAVETNIPLLGAHQAENAGVAAVLATQVGTVFGEHPGEAAIESGLRNAIWPGRTEVLPSTPPIVLDGAHNEGACKRLAATLCEFDYDDLYIVAGIMHDKRIPAMVAALPDPAVVFATAPRRDRAADTAVIERSFARAGVDERRTVDAVPAAVDAARQEATADDLVLVTGSLFTVAEARFRWSATPRTTARTPGRTPPQFRTVELRLTAERATAVQRAMAATGGDCSFSDDHRSGARPRITLSGTDEQFEQLHRRLGNRPQLVDVAAALETALSERVQTTGPWTDRTSVMGILNVTPDSFHDGGRYETHETAVARADTLIKAGVDIVDVGGESTRPGAEPVPPNTERDRVVPVIDALADRDVVVSVDTRKASVARAAVDAGADLINDVSGLSDPAMRFVAAETDTPLVLMHSINTPVDPATSVAYDDVVRDVATTLAATALEAREAGVPREHIILDPGLGFGKAPQESFALLARLPELRSLGYPLLVGHSHKSMFEAAGYDAGERLVPTVAASTYAAANGADILRVHDPSENVAAVRTVQAIRDAED